MSTRSTAAPSAPGAPSADDDVPGTSHRASTMSTTSTAAPSALGDLARGVGGPCVVASFDGGVRANTGRSAYAWCVWSMSHHLLHWEAHTFAVAQTNNAMETQGLLACLSWLRHHLPHGTDYVFGDSSLIINQALTSHACNSSSLRPWIAAIRSLGAGMPLIYLQHMRRGHNGASYALCNWIMDSVPPAVDHVDHGDQWPCLPPYAAAQSPATSLGYTLAPPRLDDTTAHTKAAWLLVLQELTTVAHLLTARFAPGLPSLPTFSPVVQKLPAPCVDTTARSLHSEFDTAVPRTAFVSGLLRCVPADIFHRLQETATRLQVPFPLDTAFLAAGPGPLRIPLIDAKILDAFVSDPELGIAGTLELFRGQAPLDSRPDKALRPWLYRAHLPTYQGLSLMCAIADHGIVPSWVNPDQRLGARPLSDNYIGAINGASIVTDKLLADYYKGRCLIASLAVLATDRGFHSSAFALVPKKDKPLHVDGRIIHDLSAPVGVSVNDLTDSLASPDATWDPFLSIALRICDLRRRYPGYAIYAMVADIADAFHDVPVHARHTSAFGGKLPRSSHGIISGMAVFGWTSSPGFFAVFGKAVRHYQRTGASRVMGFIEPFWIFQWVDDIVLIEVDIDDRLQKAEKRLRDGVKLVFGSDGWHEGKFTTWSRIFHAVGIDWNIPAEYITVPQRKVDKMHKALTDVLDKPFVSMKQLDSLVGVLRHVITFIPITKPFLQRLIAVQTRCRRGRRTGVAVSAFHQKDLIRWKDLVFQNEFAGIPMRLLDRNRVIDDI